ncbi:MAG TPA: cobalamin biosynthesis protein CbiD [Epulopiscium sp.]|nr:cobalamin biosynthesis protein CbiD [Candidatus Epulonipiscium sp.]
MYIETNGKKLRCGYTTGSSAAAAAKAATLCLYRGIESEFIHIDTPAGIDLDIKIDQTRKSPQDEAFEYVECAVIKDGGDDPDVTHGIEIWARARKIEKGYVLKGGKGVGVVMSEGLYVPKGDPAINPVPREMIHKEVMKVLPEGAGVEITIFVPEGEKVALKTFNPRLNIIGGISILGTSGIVKPMSEDALTESITLEIRQKIAQGHKELVFVFGNMGEKFCQINDIPIEAAIMISNYVGHALGCVMNKDIDKITLVGHIGKVCKIAASCMNTHSKVCGIRQEVLALELALMGAPRDLVQEINEQITTEASIKVIGDRYPDLYKRIVYKVKKAMETHIYNEIPVEVVMFHGSSEMKLLYSTLKGDEDSHGN